MKLLQINSVCGVKSTGRIATDIAAVAEEDGHVCKIAYGRDFVPAYAERLAYRIGGSFSVRAHALIARIRDSAGLGSKRATKKFIDWIKEFDPDVIHLHNLHGYYLHLPMLFAYLKETDKKVVWTLHDCWAMTGHCAHFDYCGCQKWQSGCESCPQKGEYPKTLVDKSKRNYAWKKQAFLGVKDMTIVTPSKWLAGLVKQSFLKEYPVQVIPNGVDRKVFQPTQSDLRERYGLQGKKILLGAASPWGKKKGLQDFYELANRLDENYQVVLLGLNKAQIKKASKKVLALPPTSSVEELAGWYTQADVFVNCTYEETLSMVNLEAQACGCPVVTYGAGGTVETAQKEYVVQKGDIDGLLSVLPKAIKERKVIDLTKFEKSSAIAQYLQVYQGRK